MAWWERDENLWHVYDSATGDPSDERLSQLEGWDGISSDELKELFAIGFIDESASPEEREEARDLWWDIMEDLGYDVSDFDWDSWRDWYDSQ